MGRPKVLVTRRWPAAAEEALSQRFAVTFNPTDQALTGPELAEALTSHDALLPTVTDRIDAQVLSAAPLRARVIANYGVGFSHIDLEAARARGLVVTNTPDVLTDATADLAMTLLLMAARRAGEGERQLRAGRWTGWSPTHLVGAEVSGQTLGVIGLGRIGRAVALRASRGFAMKIVHFNRRPVVTPSDWTASPTLEEVLSTADFVSLHVPGGAPTRHLIDRKRLELMPRHGILVNTSRGEIIDETALAEALAAGRIAAAGLDVYEDEPRVNPLLLSLENVVLLPHMGSATGKARVAMGLRVIENLTAYFDGRTPPDLVT